MYASLAYGRQGGRMFECKILSFEYTPPDVGGGGIQSIDPSEISCTNKSFLFKIIQ